MSDLPQSSCLRKRHALLTRRAVLAGAGLLATTVACQRQSQSVIVPAQKPRVTIAKAEAYDDRLYDILRRAVGQHPTATGGSLDVKGKRIVLKPNLVEFDPNTPVNTHPTFVHAVRETFLGMGAAEVLIAEGPGHRRDALDLADAAGYFRTIRGFEDLFHDLNMEEVTRLPLNNPFSKLNELYLPKVLLGADLIVSVAKMKTHHWVGATLTMKNFFGTVPGSIYGWPKNVLHWSGIPECIADLHNIYPRTFGIVDGIVGMEGNGPIQGTQKFAGVVVTGDDLPAVDATCARIMGIDPQRFPYLQLAANHGQMLAENVHQIGESIASVQTDFDLFGDHKTWRLPRE